MTKTSKLGRVIAAGSIAIALLSGCRQDMHDEPKFYPQRGSHFYADGRSVRAQVLETVARSQAEEGDYFHTGLVNGKEADGLPVPLTPELMERGQERYNVYCSPCHSRVGNGMGRIVERGYHPAANFHSTRLRDAPLGHFFQVITNGFGAMPNYAAEVTPADRWAIAAYIRALQLSQNARATDTGASTGSGPHLQRLTDIETSQGFAPGFLAVWFPSARPYVAPAVAAAPTPAPASTPAVSNTPASAPGNSQPLIAATARATPAAVGVQPAAKAAEGPAAKASTAAKPATAPAPAQAAPAAAPAKAGGGAHSAAAGKEIYLKNCAMCHQPTRAGMPPMIPALIGIVPKVGEEHIRSVVTNGIPTGKPPMPAFTTLSADDIENLIAFLKTDAK